MSYNQDRLLNASRPYLKNSSHREQPNSPAVFCKPPMRSAIVTDSNHSISEREFDAYDRAKAANDATKTMNKYQHHRGSTVDLSAVPSLRKSSSVEAKSVKDNKTVNKYKHHNGSVVDLAAVPSISQVSSGGAKSVEDMKTMNKYRHHIGSYIDLAAVPSIIKLSSETARVLGDAKTVNKYKHHSGSSLDLTAVPSLTGSEYAYNYGAPNVTNSSYAYITPDGQLKEVLQPSNSAYAYAMPMQPQPNFFAPQFQAPVQYPYPMSYPMMPQTMPPLLPQNMAQIMPQTMAPMMPQTMTPMMPQNMAQAVPNYYQGAGYMYAPPVYGGYMPMPQMPYQPAGQYVRMEYAPTMPGQPQVYATRKTDAAESNNPYANLRCYNPRKVDSSCSINPLSCATDVLNANIPDVFVEEDFPERRTRAPIAPHDVTVNKYAMREDSMLDLKNLDASFKSKSKKGRGRSKSSMSRTSEVDTRMDIGQLPDLFMNNYSKPAKSPVAPQKATLNKNLRGADSLADLNAIVVDFGEKPTRKENPYRRIYQPSNQVSSSSDVSENGDTQIDHSRLPDLFVLPDNGTRLTQTPRAPQNVSQLEKDINAFLDVVEAAFTAATGENVQKSCSNVSADDDTKIEISRLPDVFVERDTPTPRARRPVAPQKATLNKNLRGAESLNDLHGLDVHFENKGRCGRNVDNNNNNRTAVQSGAPGREPDVVSSNDKLYRFPQ